MGIKLNLMVLEILMAPNIIEMVINCSEKGQIAIWRCPDGAKDLLIVLKGGSKCHRVVEVSLVFRALYWVPMVHKCSRLVLFGPYEASGKYLHP